MAAESDGRKTGGRRGQGARGAPPAVVGIGVCTASLNSLDQLFAALPTDLDAAYVIAVRQQDGLTVNTVVDTLKTRTALPVTIALGGEQIEAGHIYVGGPDNLITIGEEHIITRLTEQPAEKRGTVDKLLMSLAEQAEERSVAIILTGLGSEGTAGVTATQT